MIIDHTDPRYIAEREALEKGRHNGCYYYSKEIVDNIIPNVKTNRSWNTLGTECTGCVDGAIVFLHNNASPHKYKWLKAYKDLVLVVSNKYTALAVQYLGKVIYLPLSVDVDYVSKFKTEKTKDTCYVGNLWPFKKKTMRLLDHPDMLTDMPREEILRELAKYKKAYAIGRCAIEAKVLGCKVLPCDSRYPDPGVWKVLSNQDAAKILQDKLNELGG